jgi:ubiquinone/menaquinone biosynthesis C-methylase UbiE
MSVMRPVAAPTTHWQELADGYDDIMGSDRTMRALLCTIEQLLPPDVESVLDLGTGTGALLAYIGRRRAGTALAGLDPAPAMVEQARDKLGAGSQAELWVGSAADIDAPDERFDAVVSNFALHHLPHDEKHVCAREVLRVLRPGGVFVFGDQYCRSMGGPSDPDWVDDVLELFSAKARYFHREVSRERMLLQLELLPRLATADGELPVTPEFWLQCLEAAGFEQCAERVVEPAFLMHRVMSATKPRDQTRASR